MLLQYQKDILCYYQWVVDTIIRDYRPIILMVNLADEPFGGDYSPYAEVAFKEKTGLTFREAQAGGDEEKRALGAFQSDYIVRYAAWSAEAWHSVCPDIPSTMSFCGFHAREENILPSVVGLFADTPPYFHPTFDVYPRDGDQKTAVSEQDVIMLTLLLRQMGYLSNKYQKPYWLWTTGNSWGLGQGSADKANIADAIVNQIMAVNMALENGGLLAGFAVWNYNVKFQGLYNDVYETVYDIEDMLSKLTRVVGCLRDFARRDLRRASNLAIVADRDYAHTFIAKSHKTTLVRPFAFKRFTYAAKNNINLFMDERLAEILSFCDARGESYPPALIYLTSGDRMPSLEEEESLKRYLSNARYRALLPRALVEYLRRDAAVAAAMTAYDEMPDSLQEEHLSEFLQNNGQIPDHLFHFNLGEMEVAYNLTGSARPLALKPEHRNKLVTHLRPFADLKEQHPIGTPDADSILLDHHEIAFISGNDSGDLKRIMEAINTHPDS